jgi:hypothetical protein
MGLDGGLDTYIVTAIQLLILINAFRFIYWSMGPAVPPGPIADIKLGPTSAIRFVNSPSSQGDGQPGDESLSDSTPAA